MSSLSATQADGYYIPPQYLTSGAYKKKSVSEFTTGSKKKESGSNSRTTGSAKTNPARSTSGEEPDSTRTNPMLVITTPLRYGNLR